MNVKPPEFHIGDSWSLYEERLRQFFVAYGIEEKDDERRSAFLLTAVSMEVYQTIKDLCFPAKPETKMFDELCILLRQRFTPTLVIFHERTRFIEARQGDGESVIEWSTRLKKLAAECEFGNDLPVFLKNIFVVGLKRGPIYERVCEEDPNSEMEVLVKTAMKKESTLRQREVLEIFKVRSDRGRKEDNLERPDPDSRCFACGKGNHNFRTCQYKAYVCKLCELKGHLAKVCPNRKDPNEGATKPKVHHLAMNRLDIPPPVIVPVRVGGYSINFELDTGSPVNAIPKALFHRLFKSMPLEAGGSEDFVSYNGNNFRAAGKFRAKMEFRHHKSKEVIFVFDGDRQPLLGRQTMWRWGLTVDFGHSKEHMKEVNAPSKKDSFPKFYRTHRGARAFEEKAKPGIFSDGPVKAKRSFRVNETVYVRDYRLPKKKSWIRGRIVAKRGSGLYECHTKELGVIIRRSHQINKYPYDDFGSEADLGSNDDDPMESHVKEEESHLIPESHRSQKSISYLHHPDGIYVSRCSRIINHFVSRRGSSCSVPATTKQPGC